MRGDRFTAEQKARDFAYYEPLTVRDSSLSACVQAVVAAEVGHLELAYDYFGEAALMDLGDLERQHPRRPAHRVAGRLLDRGRGRLRRDARPRRRAVASARGCRPRSSRLRSASRYRGQLPAVEISTRVRYESERRAARDRHDDEPSCAGEPARAAWTSGDPGRSRAAAGPRAAAPAGVEVDRADRRLVGQLRQQLVDDPVDLGWSCPKSSRIERSAA